MEKNWEPDAALIDQASEYGISIDDTVVAIER